MGRMTSTEDPLGGTTTTEFTPAGRVHRVTDQSGAVTTFEYDHCGRPAGRLDAAGRRWAFRYDADGALVETAAPDGTSERFAYDEAGRLVEHHVPGRGLTLYAYDERGQAVAITDSRTGMRRFAYDAAGQLVAVIDANGAITRFTYDARGRVSEIHDALGGTITRTYDGADRLVREADQLGRETTWDYDAAGRLVAHVDGAGRRREWSYDASGSVCTFGAEGDEPVQITRDALGREVAITEPGGRTHEFTWDQAGRLVERRRDGLALQYGYDDYGRRAFIGYPDGSRTHYRYGADGLLAGLQHPATGTIALERDAAGRIVAARGAGLDGRWDYEDGELVGYKLGTSSARLERDEAGRLVAAAIDGLPEQRFAYDAAGQLVSAGDRTFTYDAGGRLAQERSPLGAVDYSYDAAGQLLARRPEGGAASIFEYDGSGRRVRRGRAHVPLGRARPPRRDRGRGAHHGDDVDALGELAGVDGAALMWDTADPLAPLAWLDDRAVVGNGTPWALAATARPSGLRRTGRARSARRATPSAPRSRPRRPICASATAASWSSRA